MHPHDRRARPRLEVLEDRAVPTTAVLSGGVLTVRGSNLAETIRVKQVNGNLSVTGINISTTNGFRSSVSASVVTSISVVALGGNDVVECGSSQVRGQQAITKPIRVDAGSGNDYVRTDAGNDTLIGGSGDDKLFGLNGNDAVYGHAGNDILVGWDGNDFLSGGDHNDTISGGRGHDNLYGGVGNDTLVGDDGNDGLYGGTGSDALYGKAGNDRFLGFHGRIGAQDIGATDTAVYFVNGTRSWTNADIELIDRGLTYIHFRTGSTTLLRLKSGGAVRFHREARPADGGNYDALNHGDGRISIFDAGLSDREYAPLNIIHELGHNWDEEHATWNTTGGWLSLSGWRSTNPSSTSYRKSTDGKWWYLNTAHFAREYGRTNPREHFASSWESYFAYRYGMTSTAAQFSIVRLSVAQTRHLDVFFSTLR